MLSCERAISSYHLELAGEGMSFFCFICSADLIHTKKVFFVSNVEWWTGIMHGAHFQHRQFDGYRCHHFNRFYHRQRLAWKLIRRPKFSACVHPNSHSVLFPHE